MRVQVVTFLGLLGAVSAIHVFTPQPLSFDNDTVEAEGVTRDLGRQGSRPQPVPGAGGGDYLHAALFVADGPVGKIAGRNGSTDLLQLGIELPALEGQPTGKALEGQPTGSAEHKEEPTAGQVDHHPLHHSFTNLVIRAVVVVAAALVIFFVFNRWHEEIQMRTAIKVEHVCCAAYAALSIAIDLSIKNAANANGGKYAFNPACAVVTVEVLKLVVSAGLFASNARSTVKEGKELVLPGARDIAWLGVPGLVYTCNNMIVFKAIERCPLAAFGVIRETMLIWNALLWTSVFGAAINRLRWLSILIIFIGCIANQLPAFFRSEFSWGVLWAFLLAFSNAAGGVANEFAMKRKAAIDINLQNVILYFFCGSFGFLYIIFFSRETLQAGFFHGFTPPCVQVVVLQVLTGLAVSRILKYVDAVTKTIVAALRGPGVIFFGALVFHTYLHVNEVIATLVVCIGCFIYLRQGPLAAPPAPGMAAKAAK